MTAPLACRPAGPAQAELTPVTVQLSWTHQAQFAGFYAASQNRYYADEGLAVTLLPGGPSTSVAAAVASGSAQFGVAGAEVVLGARAAGQPVQAIAVVFQHSPRVYVTLAESGITRPQDFVGKKIAVNVGGSPLLVAMMQGLGIAEDRYTVVDSTSNLEQLISGAVDVRSVYLTNEVLALAAAGHALNIIYPDDYGIHNYADTIIATEQTITTSPDLVLRFLRASLKGWTWAVENSSQTGLLVLKYQPDADPALENDKMAAALPLINTGDHYIGWMEAETWIGMEKVLREQGVLPGPVDVTRTYTMRFLQEIYGTGASPR